jgi:hypothetical protein
VTPARMGGMTTLAEQFDAAADAIEDAHPARLVAGLLREIARAETPVPLPVITAAGELAAAVLRSTRSDEPAAQ